MTSRVDTHIDFLPSLIFHYYFLGSVSKWTTFTQVLASNKRNPNQETQLFIAPHFSDGTKVEKRHLWWSLAFGLEPMCLISICIKIVRKGKKILKKLPQLLAYFLNVILVCSPLHAFNVQVLHFVSLLIHMWFKHCGAEEILLGSCAPCYHCVLPASLCTEYIVLNNRKIDTYVDYLWLYVFLSV